MLTRFRIEVEAGSAAEAEEALTKYEHAIQVCEAERFGIRQQPSPTRTLISTRAAAIGAAERHLPKQVMAAAANLLREAGEPAWAPWEKTAAERDYFNDQLGREVTDEVIEFDPGLPGYRGRRVVRFRRIDTRNGGPTTDPPIMSDDEPRVSTDRMRAA